MTPRGVSTISRPKHTPQGVSCRCHPNLRELGHLFDCDLRCVNGGCFATWLEQQENPTRCTGLWGRREEEKTC